MKKIFLASILCFVASLVSFSQDWKPTTAAVTFKIKHALGSTANGSFKGFIGAIKFNTNELTNSSISGSVDTKTLSTGLGIRDKELKTKEYFDVENYPKISIKSTKIEKGNKANSFVGTFVVTIKKVTKTIQIPFTFLEKEEGQAIFSASFPINRTEFGVGESSKLLADIAQINVLINVSKK
jgi:polyisoprenoid-binding protein YceI